MEHLDIKVLDRNNRWTKVKHVFKNDRHNTPLMMHIYYVEHDKEYCLSCTEDHPLFTGENFVRADQLKVGDIIYRADGLAMPISRIGWHWKSVDSYDIGTASGTFIGSDIIMHNCRTRTYENQFGPKTSVGRGNLSFTSINLPGLERIDTYHFASLSELIYSKIASVNTEDIFNFILECGWVRADDHQRYKIPAESNCRFKS